MDKDALDRELAQHRRFLSLGDEAALSSLFELWGPRLLAVAARLAPDEPGARRVVVACAARVGGAAYHGPTEDFAPWLYGHLIAASRALGVYAPGATTAQREAWALANDAGLSPRALGLALGCTPEEACARVEAAILALTEEASS